MKARYDVTFSKKSDRQHETGHGKATVGETDVSEAETEFYVKGEVKIEGIHTAAFGTTLDLVWPSAESVPDAIEP